MLPKAVIGLTGTFGSGCTTAAKVLRGERGFSVITLSDEIRREWSNSNRGAPSRTDLQRLGDRLREQRARSVLVDLAHEHQLGNTPQLLAIDSIRNVGELENLRDRYGYRFLLVGVIASPEERWIRVCVDEYQGHH